MNSKTDIKSTSFKLHNQSKNVTVPNKNEKIQNVMIFLNCNIIYIILWGFPSGSEGKNLPAMQEPQEMQIQSLGWEDHLEEDMATHSSVLAWRIPWTEEPGGLQSIGFQRVRHD